MLLRYWQLQRVEKDYWIYQSLINLEKNSLILVFSGFERHLSKSVSTIEERINLVLIVDLNRFLDVRWKKIQYRKIHHRENTILFGVCRNHPVHFFPIKMNT